MLVSCCDPKHAYDFHRSDSYWFRDGVDVIWCETRFQPKEYEDDVIDNVGADLTDSGIQYYELMIEQELETEDEVAFLFNPQVFTGLEWIAFKKSNKIELHKGC